MDSSGFDVVQKAKHYNSHPSGVETKLVIRSLDFNLGCVFKYVVRRKDKEPERSLKSALFYLKDHFENSNDCPATPEHCRHRVVGLILQHADADTDAVAKNFYMAFSNLVQYPNRKGRHEVVEIYLEELLKEIVC